MKRKLEVSELIFKILAYTFLTVFALLCLYPFLYAISASMSGRHAVEYKEIILLTEGNNPEATWACAAIAPITICAAVRFWQPMPA